MSPSPSLRSERGVTLTELTIATVLASVVMLGLVGFYMGSQGVWIDSSGQALTQREATGLSEMITEAARGARTLVAYPVSGDSVWSLTLYRDDAGGFEHSEQFVWHGSDRRVHRWVDGTDRGATAASEVRRFVVRAVQDTAYLEFEIGMRSPENHVVAVNSGVRLQNHR